MWTDQLLGRLVDQVPPGTLVVVASTVPPTDEWRLMPVVIAGPGVAHGELHSPSTRHLGLVTLTDLGPTILSALGAPVPSGMIGHAVQYHQGDADRSSLAQLDRDIAFRERIYLAVALGFIVLQGLAYLTIVWVVSRTRGRRRSRWAPVLRDVAIAIAAFPLATFLFRAVLPYAPGFGPGATQDPNPVAGTVLLPLVLVLIVVVARRARRSALSPLAWVFGATVAVMVLDVATGARLQVGGILGYSPQSAGRFFGLGNTAFAVLAGCTLLVAALHLDRAPRFGEALVAVAALFVLVVVVDGAPSLGDDVGGILTLVPVFGATLLAFRGRRLTGKAVAAVVGVAVGVLALATTVDLVRPQDRRTHLGRLVADSWHHGVGELVTTIARKSEANVRLLRLTPWAWAVPIIAAFLLYVLVVRRGWAHLLPPRSPLRLGVVGALTAGVLGSVVNDSGVIVTALVLVEVGPLLAMLVLTPPPGQPVLLEPGPVGPPVGLPASRSGGAGEAAPSRRP
jgi:hypothetical protein